MLKYGGIDRYKKASVSFLNFKFFVPDTLSFLWQFKEIFAEEFYLFNTTKKEPIIFDCGANLGLSCLFYKVKFPGAKVKAYEADPIIAEMAKENLRLNGIESVEILAKAVWINNGFIELSREGADGANFVAKENLIRVPCIRLKEEIDREEKIDFLKMDIEGAETSVIKDCGQSLRKVENLFIEYHSFRGYPQELDIILKILSENNFRYHILPVNLKKRPFMFLKEDNSFMDLQLNIFATQI